MRGAALEEKRILSRSCKKMEREKKYFGPRKQQEAPLTPLYAHTMEILVNLFGWREDEATVRRWHLVLQRPILTLVKLTLTEYVDAFFSFLLSNFPQV